MHPSNELLIDPAQLSREHYAETVTLTSILGAALLLGGLGGGSYALVGAGDATEAMQVGGVAALLLALGIGLGLFARGRSRRIAPFFSVVNDRMHEVVWVHLRTRRGAPPAARVWVTLATLDGRSEMLSVIGLARAEALVQTLASRAPGATTGWSWELVQQFARDPRSLRRA